MYLPPARAKQTICASGNWVDMFRAWLVNDGAVVATDPPPSRFKVNQSDIDGCTCTPPVTLCLWGTVCNPCLYANTNYQLKVASDYAKAAAARNNSPGDQTAKNKVKMLLAEMAPDNYCGVGMSQDAVEVAFIGAAADTVGEGGSSITTGIIAIRQYHELLQSNALVRAKGNLPLMCRGIVCGPCMVCTNAYALHKKLREVKSHDAEAVVSVQPGVVNTSGKYGVMEKSALLM